MARRAGYFWLTPVLLVALALITASCGSAGTTSGKDVPVPSSAGGPSTSAGPLGPIPPAPLTAPKATPQQDGQYFTDLGEADPSLATYVQKEGNVGLRALLTDGSAFCAFLARGGGIDNAMASVVEGARTVETQTHLPSTVATYNAIDAVALLNLCPSEQKLLPAHDQSQVRALGEGLSRKTS